VINFGFNNSGFQLEKGVLMELGLKKEAKVNFHGQN
jgi:hypothetical protein